MVSIRERIGTVNAIVDVEFSGCGIPGLAVGIVHEGKLVHVKCLGTANIDSAAPVNVNTAFRLASISKAFTTVGLLQLWESGRFQMDDPVNKYLPKGKLLLKAGWPEVTFTHLLTHQAGIGEIMQKRDLLKPGYGLLVKGRNTPVPPLSTLHDKPLHPEVAAGTKYAYSNIGFSLLGYIIEQLSGESFREYMVQHVLDPLGMDHSDFLPTARLGGNEAMGYKRSFGRIVPATYYQNIIAPAGNLISSINDMACFATMLLSKGALPGGKRLLKASTVDEAFSPHYWASDALKEEASIGLCFHLYRINNTRIIEHTGATSGFTSAMSLIPSMDLAVLVFSNIDEIFGARRTLEIKHKILVALLGVELQTTSGMHAKASAAVNIPGYYGPIPGVLTNTRILGYYGGDFKISAKQGKLFLSSMYGTRKGGVELIPTGRDEHFTLRNPKRPLARLEHLACIVDGDGHVTGLALEHFKLRRNRFVQTLRFKVYLLCVVAVAAISSILVFMLLSTAG